MLKVLAIFPLCLFRQELRDKGVQLIAIIPSGKSVHPDDVEFDFYGNPSGLPDFVRKLFDKHQPDIIFQDDDSSPLLHAGLEDLPVPKIWYAIDSHLHNWHKHFSAIFDFVFYAQKNRAVEFEHFQKNSAWLPLCMTISGTKWVPWSDRHRDSVFVGTLDEKINPARVALLKKVQELGVSVEIIRQHYLEIYPYAKIVINQSARNDLNFRFFEAGGCGALLITDEIGQSDAGILTPGEDFLLYKGAEDLAEKIKWVLAHPEIAEAMGRRAFDKIQSGHLASHRAQTILEKLTQMVGSKTTRTDFQKAQLAFSLQLSSFINYPQNLLDFFQAKSDRLLQEEYSDPLSLEWNKLSQGLGYILRKDTTTAWNHLQSMDMFGDDEWLNQYLRHFKVATAQAFRST